MSDFKITTTGTMSPVVFPDLGMRSFIHPTVDYDLTADFQFEEIARSDDVAIAITNGYITATSNGVLITSISQLQALGTGDMSKSDYDADDNAIADKAEALDDGAGNVVTALEAKTAVGRFKFGNGNPNGVVSGNLGDYYIDQVNDTPYVNVTGSNVGWVVI